MKKILALAMVLIMAFGLVACEQLPAATTDAAPAAAAAGGKVGVAMPTESLQRWNQWLKIRG